MNKVPLEVSDLLKSKKNAKMNEVTRKIWSAIDGSAVYYVSIGVTGETASAKIESEEGISYKKVGNSLIFAHEKSRIEIPITKDITFSKFPTGTNEHHDCVGLNLRSPDFRTVASIEFSEGKTDKYYSKLRKQQKKEIKK